jgi:hypothetical protein
MITGDGIIWLIAIVIVSYYAMMWANAHRYIDKPYINLIVPAPEDWPPFFRVVFNFGKMNMLVGLGLQVFNIAFTTGLLMFLFGIALIIYAKSNITDEKRPP